MTLWYILSKMRRVDVGITGLPIGYDCLQEAMDDSTDPSDTFHTTESARRQHRDIRLLPKTLINWKDYNNEVPF